MIFLTIRRWNSEMEASPFCQDFSMIFGHPKKFDRKFRGEILQISPLKLQDFSPKFAAKLPAIFKPLIFSTLQDHRQNTSFCQIFLPIFTHAAIQQGRCLHLL
ncbi:MAG: hypothetical protein IJ928_01070 [Prevotella sp.]|nr:hypothetical protein [Prevotella sp.]